MNEEEARAAVAALVGETAYRRLETLARLVTAETERQNLIARSTLPTIWNRHMLDSIQLLQWGNRAGTWIDIGTGGGFPGLAIAAATDRDVVLVEPRRLRASFLNDAIAALGLRRTKVMTIKVESVSRLGTTISARAVAPIEKLLRSAGHCATADTRWLLLRGRPSVEELSGLEKVSGMMFHVEHSRSDPSSSIVIGHGKPAL